MLRRQGTGRSVRRDEGQWRAIALLLLVVALPSSGMLWLLSQAMRNERLAARQVLNDAYMSHLRAASDRLETRLTDSAEQVARAAADKDPAEQLLMCVQLDRCDSILACDELQQPLTVPADAVQRVPPELRERWQAARQLAESLRHTTLPPPDQRLRPSELADVWCLATEQPPLRLLLRRERIDRMAREAILAGQSSADLRIDLLAPDQEPPPQAYLLKLAGPHWPGWRLVLSLDRDTLVGTAGARRVMWYRLIVLLLIGTMAGLALLIGVTLHQQSRLARLKNDLVATVSHELKTPLASMRLLIDTLLEADDPPRGQVREYLELVARENIRLARLVEQFLTFSRMERRKHNFVLDYAEPAQLVAAARAAAGDRFQADDCRLDIEVAADLPRLIADGDALVTVLLNLLDNAYKYSPPPRHIQLRVQQENGYVAFAVEDNGIGLTRRAARRVFERFYQVDQQLSRSGSGCGLGLSIVEYIVQAHAGTIEVLSQPGQGSTFIVRIPQATAAAQELEEACS